MARTHQEFISTTDFAKAELFPLAGDASSRRYIRAELLDTELAGKSAMIMDTPPAGENFPAFVAIAQWLYNLGYSAPEILARDMENGFLLLEDFGSDSFSRILAENPAQEETLYEAAIDVLAEWKNISPLSLDIALPPYNKQVYLREVSLLSDWFLPRAFGAEKAADLGAEYTEIWEKILDAAPLEENIFVHRDYHADNLMWLEKRAGTKRVGLLDFQDGLVGDAAYDMVSLLEDARRDVSPQLAEKMLARYLKKTGAQAQRFNTAYHILGAQRNCKIIGIFVRLCERDGKDNYLRFLPRVWGYLQRDVQHPALADLRKWLDRNIPQGLRR